MGVEIPLELAEGFEGLLGLELVELSAELARGRVRVRDALLGAGGAVHAGVSASIADSLATLATAASTKKSVRALSTQTNTLSPITAGTIHAVGTTKHRGRTTWVWEVEISDDSGALCALARVTVEVRDR